MGKEEQHSMGKEEVLPAPSIAAKRTSSSGKRIALVLLALVALWTVAPSFSEGIDNEVSPYLAGIAGKGWKQSLGKHSDHHGHHIKDHKDHKGHKHGKHGKHKDHKHHPHHDHPHRPRKPISPKTAEEIFLGVPNNQSAHDTLRKLTSDPHYAGNGFDKVTALELKNDWEKVFGLPFSGADQYVYEAGSSGSQERVRGKPKLGVWIDTYYPILTTPVHTSVTLLTPEPFHAKLREDFVEGDPDSKFRDALPVNHGLSVSGNVQAQYVYVGYGRKADFDLLHEKGIDVTGKIALVKYGGNFRGLKIKAAQEAGAVGVIIYTDPGDDGEVTEQNGYKTYPDGPARQPSSVQRGSVQFISKYPGDPSTPGEPAYKNATRVEGGNQPSIPSLPMSYEDVIPILKALQGKGQRAEEVSQDWVGGLGYKGVEYWTGPSEVDLHLVNEVDTDITPIWNVAAMVPGHIEDEVIVVGNHRDAWVLGAADPNSGTAAQYETLRGIGKLVQSGWKPLRTIIFASWDAEEYGLIGSTEWAEDFGDYLQSHVAAYVNLDVAVSGSRFNAAASPSLAWLLRDATAEVQSSSGSNAALSIWQGERTDGQGKEDFKAETVDANVTSVKPLGSGSDYTAFLQRYGIASSDFGYKPGGKDAVYHYHSIYDSFTWQERFSDPGFHKHVEIAKILGLMALRLADSLVLPINTTQYSLELTYYLSKVEKLVKESNYTDTVDLQPLAKSIEGVINASKDLDERASKAVERLRKLLPKHPRRSIRGKMVRFFGSWGTGCHNQAEDPMVRWTDNPSLFDTLIKTPKIPPVKHMKEIKRLLEEVREINKKKQGFEGGFISEEGIKEREWYKHKGVAPGAWLGYGATTFPALTEAITLDHSPKLAQKEADELVHLIDGIAADLRR